MYVDKSVNFLTQLDAAFHLWRKALDCENATWPGALLTATGSEPLIPAAAALAALRRPRLRCAPLENRQSRAGQKWYIARKKIYRRRSRTGMYVDKPVNFLTQLDAAFHRPNKNAKTLLILSASKVSASLCHMSQYK